EWIVWMNPACTIGGDSSAGNNAMDVWMEQQILSPRMKNAKETNLGSEMLRIACDLQQRFSYSAEQQVVQLGFVLQHKGVKLVRQSEDDVEIPRPQQLLFPGGNPTLPRLVLALWTVTISA